MFTFVEACWCFIFCYICVSQWWILCVYELIMYLSFMELMKFWKFLCLIFLGGLCRTDERIGSNGFHYLGFWRAIPRAISVMIHLCSCLLVLHNLLIDFRHMKVFRMFRLFLYLHVCSCLLYCIYNVCLKFIISSDFLVIIVNVFFDFWI